MGDSSKAVGSFLTFDAYRTIALAVAAGNLTTSVEGQPNGFLRRGAPRHGSTHMNGPPPHLQGEVSKTIKSKRANEVVMDCGGLLSWGIPSPLQVRA